MTLNVGYRNVVEIRPEVYDDDDDGQAPVRPLDSVCDANSMVDNNNENNKEL